MKYDLENLLQEIMDKENYYLRRVDDPEFKEMQETFIGHYIELKWIKERLVEILYEKDNS